MLGLTSRLGRPALCIGLFISRWFFHYQFLVLSVGKVIYVDKKFGFLGYRRLWISASDCSSLSFASLPNESTNLLSRPYPCSHCAALDVLVIVVVIEGRVVTSRCVWFGRP
jgi:hypothetical protein